jgi:hypothetical protein
MSKLPNDCICFFYFQVGWGRGGVVWGWLYLINSLQKKTHKKHRQPPSCLFSQTWVICSFLKAKQSTCLSFKYGDHGDVGNRGWKRTFRCHWQISMQKWINLKSINIRSIIIIKQIQNMNLMLNMKEGKLSHTHPLLVSCLWDKK